MPDLLPNNSTPLERAVAAAWKDQPTIPLRTLYNPDTCPAPLLPYLAWAWSVDRWNNAWSESAKRAAIRASFFVHQRKGTIGALRRVVEPLGYLIRVTEWFELEPMGVPGTFSLDIGVMDTGITDAMYTELVGLIDDAKPLSRQLVGLAINLQSQGPAYVAAAMADGDTLTVYPYDPGPIEVSGLSQAVAGTHDIDTLSIYP